MALVTLQTNFIETKLLHGCSPVNLLHICQKAVLMNTYGELFLQIFNQHACHIFHYKLVSKLGFFLIHLTSLMLSSERAVLRLPELSLFLFRLDPCERLFARWCLKTANCYEVFLSKKICTTRKWISSRKCISNIFVSILCAELSNHDPWNSLLFANSRITLLIKQLLWVIRN